MNEIQSIATNPLPKSKTIDLRAIKRSIVDKKEDYTQNNSKSEPEAKPNSKTREVKVNNKGHTKEPYPNLLITVKSEPPLHTAEPPAKKPKLSSEVKNSPIDKVEPITAAPIPDEKDKTQNQKPIHTPESSLMKQKAPRCVYFPSCSKQNCPFFHPSEPCKNPLVCPYGPSLCRYIHPICKFGSRCSRLDCVYIHPREASIDCRNGYSCTKKDTCTFRHPPEACIYSPKCRNQVCTYSHAPPCQFGVNCGLPGCTYAHKSLSVLPGSSMIPSEESIEVLSATLPKTPPRTEEQPQSNEVQG